MSQSSSNTVPPVEKWLQSFDAWYSDIEQNHRYQESAHCYFELDETSQPFLNVTIVLTKTPSKRPETDAPATPAPEDEENKSKQSEGSTVDNEPHKRINSESHKLVKLLPTREEAAQGRIVVRLPQAAPLQHRLKQPSPATQYRETNQRQKEDFPTRPSFKTSKAASGTASTSTTLWQDGHFA